jgi:ribonuclease T2
VTNLRSALGATLSALMLATAGAARALPGADQPGHFDYYVLALSWAPTFCESHPADHAECGVRRGFVVHGLWPQYEAGGGPQHCTPAAPLDPETEAQALSAMPDPRLIRHEWTTHGSCTGLTPHDYFLSVIRSVGRLTIPQEFDGEAPRSLTAEQIVSTFTKANPSLTDHSLALHCRGPELAEVRICLSRDLSPQPCSRGVRTHCPAGALTIGAGAPSPPAPLPR